MTYKTCATCTENDFGICGRLGRPVEDKEACDLHGADWVENLLQRFLEVK